MAARRVFLDANVIIEAFRIGVWRELARQHHLETVQMCERESLTGQTTTYGKVDVQSAELLDGLKASHDVSRAERNALIKAHRACADMDPGEKDLFAHLFTRQTPLPPIIAISSADKGVIVRAKDLGWLEHLISLEELMVEGHASKQKMIALDYQYSSRFLGEKRLQVRMGIIP